jgi:hypothetical protein
MPVHRHRALMNDHAYGDLPALYIDWTLKSP